MSKRPSPLPLRSSTFSTMNTTTNAPISEYVATGLVLELGARGSGVAAGHRLALCEVDRGERRRLLATEQGLRARPDVARGGQVRRAAAAAPPPRRWRGRPRQRPPARRGSRRVR